MCANYELEPPKVGPYDRRPPVKLIQTTIPHVAHSFVVILIELFYSLHHLCVTT